jgi:hypothetical protein
VSSIDYVITELCALSDRVDAIEAREIDTATHVVHRITGAPYRATRHHNGDSWELIGLDGDPSNMISLCGMAAREIHKEYRPLDARTVAAIERGATRAHDVTQCDHAGAPLEMRDRLVCKRCGAEMPR